MTTTTTTVRELPELTYDNECWLTARTFDKYNLCVRRSSIMDLREDCPEIAAFIDRYGLEVVKHFKEQDDFMVGHAVVTVYQVPADRRAA